jgi:hypothetical protein
LTGRHIFVVAFTAIIKEHDTADATGVVIRRVTSLWEQFGIQLRLFRR